MSVCANSEGKFEDSTKAARRWFRNGSDAALLDSRSSSLVPDVYMLGHAAADGHPLSEHITTLSPVPSGWVEVVVAVLHAARGGITVAMTVLLFPTMPVT